MNPNDVDIFGYDEGGPVGQMKRRRDPDRDNDPLITPAQLSYLAAQFAPGTGLLDASGRMAAMPGDEAGIIDAFGGEYMPSIGENIAEGEYFDAAMQGLGVLGDAMYAVPLVGPVTGVTLGSTFKGIGQAGKGIKKGIESLSGLGPDTRVTKDFDAGPVEEGQGHAMPSDLLVPGSGEKATTPVVQKFTPQNTDQVIQKIDEVKANNPEALTSTENWKGMEDQAFGGSYVPMPPLEAINYKNNPQLLAQKLQKLTPELKAGVDEGFGYVQDLRNIYNSGNSSPEMTGRLMLWGILSRGAGPVQQEAAFLDVLDAARPFIKKAVDGEFGPKDKAQWQKTAAELLPEGSPGKQVTMNVNAAGRLLESLSQKKGPGGEVVLNRLHDLMSNPEVSGRQFRREFFQMTDSPGIDNKVVSFIGLVGGKDDMLVMDRIQSRHLWDDGRFGGANIYDGLPMGKVKTGLANILGGPRGLLVTEQLEDGLENSVKQAYDIIGRPEDASIGRMHWETWVIDGDQAVSHSTLNSVLRDSPIGGAVREGKPGTFSSGSTYRMTVEGPIIEYPLSDGSLVRMTPERFKDFLGVVKKPKTGILPDQFKVSAVKGKPWYTKEGVDRSKLDDLARQYENANPDGSLRSGARRALKGADSVSQRRGDFLRSLRINRARQGVQERPDGLDPGRSSQAYTRGVRSTDEGVRLLDLQPNAPVSNQFQYAGLNTPRISQIPAAENASAYEQQMRSSLVGKQTGAQVEIKTPEELAETRLFQTESGSGFSIKSDGDITAVYASEAEPSGGAYAMLEAAVEAGGRKLDAFDTYLPKIYETVGFRPVSKIKWNDEFAPKAPSAVEDWDKQKFIKYNNGEPDVVFFVYDPDYTGSGGAAKLNYSEDYDAAVAVQNAEVEKIKPRVDEVLGPAPEGFYLGGSVGIQPFNMMGGGQPSQPMRYARGGRVSKMDQTEFLRSLDQVDIFTNSLMRS